MGFGPTEALGTQVLQLEKQSEELYLNLPGNDLSSILSLSFPSLLDLRGRCQPSRFLLPVLSPVPLPFPPFPLPSQSHSRPTPVPLLSTSGKPVLHASLHAHFISVRGCPELLPPCPLPSAKRHEGAAKKQPAVAGRHESLVAAGLQPWLLERGCEENVGHSRSEPGMVTHCPPSEGGAGRLGWLLCPWCSLERGPAPHRSAQNLFQGQA